MMYQCHIWFTMEHFYIPISYEMRFMRDFSPLSLSISRPLASSLLFSAANFDRQSSFHCTSWFHLMPFLLHSGRIVPHKTVIHRSMNVMDFLLYQYNIALEFIFTSLFWCWCCCCCSFNHSESLYYETLLFLILFCSFNWRLDSPLTGWLAIIFRQVFHLTPPMRVQARTMIIRFSLKSTKRFLQIMLLNQITREQFIANLNEIQLENDTFDWNCYFNVAPRFRSPNMVEPLNTSWNTE